MGLYHLCIIQIVHYCFFHSYTCLHERVLFFFGFLFFFASNARIVGRLRLRHRQMMNDDGPTSPPNSCHGNESEPRNHSPLPFFKTLQDAYHQYQTSYPDSPLLWSIFFKNLSVLAKSSKRAIHFSSTATYSCYPHIGTIETMEAHS